MISSEQVASTLADLVERIAARNTAPCDQPFPRPTSSMSEFRVVLKIAIPDGADPAEVDRCGSGKGPESRN